MSFLRQLTRRIFSRGYVGSDLRGNTFYEVPHALAGHRARRRVKYAQESDMWDYIGGGKQLPIQWSAWLAYTRSDPPSIEELQQDELRRHNVLIKAAEIEARDDAERRMIHATQVPSQAQNLIEEQKATIESEPKIQQHPQIPSTERYEPEPWVPTGHRRRRGG